MVNEPRSIYESERKADCDDAVSAVYCLKHPADKNNGWCQRKAHSLKFTPRTLVIYERKIVK